ncbi:MAG: hypothetical protein A2010_12520 [Nitrospirae bacterium GWD2_57_9]|nr:MAG: hypothetical protein A2010_12520 [Nitrospirae bacterium GWD2_57_9]
MALANQIISKNKPSAQPFSPQILARFSNPLDCLTAHLMLECSEVLAGVKPANLISLVNRTRPCGRNIYHLWQRHHEELAIRLADLNFMLLQTKQRALLLLCYNHKQLEDHLAHAGIRTLLRKAGYEAGASCEELLEELSRRIGKNDSFPHEIGLFIGYPAKDVAAFMGLVKLPFACQGPWKIYGNPVLSLGLAAQYRCCRQRMSAILASGNHKALELQNPGHPFFCKPIDNELHYP